MHRATKEDERALTELKAAKILSPAVARLLEAVFLLHDGSLAALRPRDWNILRVAAKAHKP